MTWTRVGLVEDEKKVFMKSKLWNQLVGHLNIFTCMFAKDFLNFLFPSYYYKLE
jgi:hypothetical protein